MKVISNTEEIFSISSEDHIDQDDVFFIVNKTTYKEIMTKEGQTYIKDNGDIGTIKIPDSIITVQKYIKHIYKITI